MNQVNITVVGAGYVGLSNAVLLSQVNQVLVLETSQDKVSKINRKISPILDQDISNFFRE